VQSDDGESDPQPEAQKRGGHVELQSTVSASLGGVNFMVHKEMVTVEGHVHGTVAVGSTDKNPPVTQGVEHAGVRMAEQVVPAAGNESQARLHRIQEHGSR